MQPDMACLRQHRLQMGFDPVNAADLRIQLRELGNLQRLFGQKAAVADIFQPRAMPLQLGDGMDDLRFFDFAP